MRLPIIAQSGAYAPMALTLVVATSMALGPACAKHEAEAPQSVKAALPHVRVEAPPVALMDVPDFIPLTGELISERRTALTANATGQVIATQIERGQAVRRGEVVARLDIRAAEHQAAEAEANAANLQAARTVALKDCERTERLKQKDAISQQEYERNMAQCQEAAAQADAAQARLRSARKTVSDGAVRAPFDGIITERKVDVGDYVQPNSTVAVLLQPDPLRLRLTVPEVHLFAAQMGSPVTFSVPALVGETFEGTIKYVSGEVRQSSRDVVVEAVVQNHEHKLLPGMFASAMLVAGKRQRPVLPASAILDATGQPSVFIVKDNSLEQRAVRIGLKTASGIAIEAGIVAGERVVLRPDASCVDGARVD